ncbi:hypothetical protein BKA60DRAFT_571541 [Fusarium oxysporum]|nr:hypothetical protein BKA60DRAFT_571541 [Fusarium oxysporum]
MVSFTTQLSHLSFQHKLITTSQLPTQTLIMLLNKAFLGALLAMGTVTALPNPDAEPADLEDRSILHHCGKHASWDHAKSECVCHDSGKVYTKKHHKCKCPKGEKWHHIEKKCKK